MAQVSLPPIDAAYDPTLATNDADEYCWTEQQLAARGGDVERVKELLADDSVPQGYYVQTSLQAACIYGHEDARNNMQRTALQFVCGQGNEAVINMLLDHGAQVNMTAHQDDQDRLANPQMMTTFVTRYNGRTALQAAAERGHLRVVSKLLDLGADVNTVSARRGQTPIQCAIRKGHEDAAQILRELRPVGRAAGGTSLFRDR